MSIHDTNTQMVKYVGDVPKLRKFINKWDSDTFLKDFYQNEVMNASQYDLRCGQGIVIQDESNLSNSLLKIPQYPYDGDSFAICVFQKDGELNTNETTYLLYNYQPTDSKTKVFYHNTLWEPNQIIPITFAGHCSQRIEQYFTYVEMIDTWVCYWQMIPAQQIDNVKIKFRFIDKRKTNEIYQPYPVTFDIPQNVTNVFDNMSNIDSGNSGYNYSGYTYGGGYTSGGYTYGGYTYGGGLNGKPDIFLGEKIFTVPRNSTFTQKISIAELFNIFFDQNIFSGLHVENNNYNKIDLYRKFYTFICNIVYDYEDYKDNFNNKILNEEVFDKYNWVINIESFTKSVNDTAWISTLPNGNAIKTHVTYDEDWINNNNEYRHIEILKKYNKNHSDEYNQFNERFNVESYILQSYIDNLKGFYYSTCINYAFKYENYIERARAQHNSNILYYQKPTEFSNTFNDYNNKPYTINLSISEYDTPASLTVNTIRAFYNLFYLCVTKHLDDFQMNLDVKVTLYALYTVFLENTIPEVLDSYNVKSNTYNGKSYNDHFYYGFFSNPYISKTDIDEAGGRLKDVLLSSDYSLLNDDSYGVIVSNIVHRFIITNGVNKNESAGDIIKATSHFNYYFVTSPCVKSNSQTLIFQSILIYDKNSPADKLIDDQYTYTLNGSTPYISPFTPSLDAVNQAFSYSNKKSIGASSALTLSDSRTGSFTVSSTTPKNNESFIPQYLSNTTFCWNVTFAPLDDNQVYPLHLYYENAIYPHEESLLKFPFINDASEMDFIPEQCQLIYSLQPTFKIYGYNTSYSFSTYPYFNAYKIIEHTESNTFNYPDEWYNIAFDVAKIDKYWIDYNKSYIDICPYIINPQSSSYDLKFDLKLDIYNDTENKKTKTIYVNTDDCIDTVTYNAPRDNDWLNFINQYDIDPTAFLLPIGQNVSEVFQQRSYNYNPIVYTDQMKYKNISKNYLQSLYNKITLNDIYNFIESNAGYENLFRNKLHDRYENLTSNKKLYYYDGNRVSIKSEDYEYKLYENNNLVFNLKNFINSEINTAPYYLTTDIDGVLGNIFSSRGFSFYYSLTYKEWLKTRYAYYSAIYNSIKENFENFLENKLDDINQKENSIKQSIDLFNETYTTANKLERGASPLPGVLPSLHLYTKVSSTPHSYNSSHRDYGTYKDFQTRLKSVDSVTLKSKQWYNNIDPKYMDASINNNISYAELQYNYSSPKIYKWSPTYSLSQFRMLKNTYLNYFDVNYSFKEDALSPYYIFRALGKDPFSFTTKKVNLDKVEEKLKRILESDEGFITINFEAKEDVVIEIYIKNNYWELY